MSEKDTTYNGWANYETWAANLWIGDNAESQAHYLELAAELLAGPSTSEAWTVEQSAKFNLADQLKADYEENMPDVEGIYMDMLNAASQEIRWDEIARHLVDSAIEASKAKS